MELLEATSHRPWPVPEEPWVLKQSWNDLMFAHWPVPRNRVRELVPSFLELDTFDNEAWLGIAPFRVTDMSPRGLPALPWVSSFSEINVRTYVVYGGIPGVYFFSLDANSAIAVGGGSSMFHLPYFLAEMQVEDDRGRLSCTSRRLSGPDATFQAQYSSAGPLFEAQEGTLEYWLTERYCLYTHDAAGHGYRAEIHHRPWQLQTAEADIAVNTMAEAAGLRCSATAPLLHFARRLDAIMWLPQALG